MTARVRRAIPVVATFLLCGLAMAVTAPVATARVHRATTDTDGMTPAVAPLPSTLPDGNPASSAVLYGSSCSSDAFCVAVGVVEDSLDQYPLVETYADGTWTPSVAPLPPLAASYGNVLYAVSCPVDGTCAAAGDYNSDGFQDGLLEMLSDGSWTATPAALPDGSGLVNLLGVSCPDATTCTAVGNIYQSTPSWTGLIYTWSAGTWTLQTGLPVPADYQNNLELSSVSCPDDSDCVVVGSYGAMPTGQPETSHGLILTLAAGTWSAQEAPLPVDANPEPNAAGLKVLDAVDCVDAADCVAGGAYVDESADTDPLLETLANGTWTPSQAPVPPDSQTNTLAVITGMSCPGLEACVADGYYWPNYYGNDESGMVLTQSGTGWTVVPGAIPVTSGVRRDAVGRAAATSSSMSGLNSVSCPAGAACEAVGSYGDSQSDDAGLLVAFPDSSTPLAITSPDQATFATRHHGSFTLTGTGTPAPRLTEKGKLPHGLHFRSGSGSATLTGRPTAKSAGSYPITITASNGAKTKARQTLTVVVQS